MLVKKVKVKKISQKDRVLQHLKDLNSITSWEAFSDYGITRLSAVIFNLKEYGHKISSEIIDSTNRYGNPTHYSKYQLQM
jgi:hypothetical protein